MWEPSQMNQLCKVCGEPAAGYHFGAFTCEGCKSFFGRTYNNLATLGECKNNGQCVINKKNRTSCKSCRLKKCLMVGMSKSVIGHQLDKKWRSNDVFVTENIDFSGLMLSDNLLCGLRDAGFAKPSPIQLQAIPLGRCGLDLIIQAKSGTGKTCVFAVIALENINTDSSATQVLILAPTREIAVQISEVIVSIGSRIPKLRCFAFIGGIDVDEDVKKMRKCHIVVGTPGRIKHLIQKNVLDTSHVRLFVLDEADVLLVDTFQYTTNWIFSALPTTKQVIATSATYPEDVEKILPKYMQNPALVQLNSNKPSLLGITQYYMLTPHHPMPHITLQHKVDAADKILSSVPFSQCLIFANSQSRAENICDALRKKDWPVDLIYGSQDQMQRLQTMARLKKYASRILVSTDLTSRGIDAENVNLVINVDVPFSAQTYLHRVGRAGRYGSRGLVITLIGDDKEQESTKLISSVCHLNLHQLSDPIPSNIWVLHHNSQDRGSKSEAVSELSDTSDTKCSGTTMTVRKLDFKDSVSSPVASTVSDQPADDQLDSNASDASKLSSSTKDLGGSPKNDSGEDKVNVPNVEADYLVESMQPSNSADNDVCKKLNDNYDVQSCSGATLSPKTDGESTGSDNVSCSDPSAVVGDLGPSGGEVEEFGETAAKDGVDELALDLATIDFEDSPKFADEWDFSISLLVESGQQGVAGMSGSQDRCLGSRKYLTFDEAVASIEEFKKKISAGDSESLSDACVVSDDRDAEESASPKDQEELGRKLSKCHSQFYNFIFLHDSEKCLDEGVSGQDVSSCKDQVETLEKDGDMSGKKGGDDGGSLSWRRAEGGDGDTSHIEGENKGAVSGEHGGAEFVECGSGEEQIGGEVKSGNSSSQEQVGENGVVASEEHSSSDSSSNSENDFEVLLEKQRRYVRKLAEESRRHFEKKGECFMGISSQGLAKGETELPSESSSSSSTVEDKHEDSSCDDREAGRERSASTAAQCQCCGPSHSYASDNLWYYWWQQYYQWWAATSSHHSMCSSCRQSKWKQELDRISRYASTHQQYVSQMLYWKKQWQHYYCQID